MVNKKGGFMKKLLISLIAFFCIQSLSSQSVSREVVATSGSTFSSTSANLSWTLGEMMIETYSGSSAEITQGFQQTKLSVTSIDENSDKVGVKVFPNPTHNQINLQFKGKHPTYSISLYDFEGRIIREISIEKTVSNKLIDLSGEAAGTYLLKVSSEDQGILNTYKVQKINY